MDKLNALLHYWYIIPILLSVIFYRAFLRIFLGIVIVPEDKIGLITKKFVLMGANRSLPDGKIIALNGEPGYQAKALGPGLYFGYWTWQYGVDFEKFTIIPPGKIGLIIAKDGAELPMGAILARRVECDNFQDVNTFLTGGGQRGRQTAFLTSGTYRINTYAFDVVVTDMITVPNNNVGIVTTMDGIPLPTGEIAGPEIQGHNNFQDFDKFLANKGCRGLQPQVILAGSYYLNPWAVQVSAVAMTEIPIGYVGVVVSFVGPEGKDLTGENFKHGNIVEKGQRGVWLEALNPGKYPLNTSTMKVELVPTTNLVLNWANNRSESHKLDVNLSTITVRSKDGFTFNLDVSQIIHVPSKEASKVIARFGSMSNLVSQVLEPTIGNYFRNSAQNSDVIAFLATRKERQDSAKESISKVLDEYNVTAVDTLIGDITPPAQLMQTLTDRKIAEEQKTTIDTQTITQIQRQALQKETALADMQSQIVQADQMVGIEEKNAEATVKKAEGAAKSVVLQADAEAQRIEKIGEAEAGKIEVVGKATADAYDRQVKAMGMENFGKLKMIEQISEGNIKITPDFLVSGGGDSGASGTVSGLLALSLFERGNHNGNGKDIISK